MLGKAGEGHWALAAAQLLVGACFVIPQWVLGVRAKPDLTLDHYKVLAPIGFFNAAAHGASVLALGAGMFVFLTYIHTYVTYLHTYVTYIHTYLQVPSVSVKSSRLLSPSMLRLLVLSSSRRLTIPSST